MTTKPGDAPTLTDAECDAIIGPESDELEANGGAMKPMDSLLESVEWVESDSVPDGGDMPYATHSGVLDIAGFPKLRCYRLSTGQAVLNADDIEEWLSGEPNPR